MQSLSYTHGNFFNLIYGLNNYFQIAVFLKRPVKLAYVSHLPGIENDDYMHMRVIRNELKIIFSEILA